MVSVVFGGGIEGLGRESVIALSGYEGSAPRVHVSPGN